MTIYALLAAIFLITALLSVTLTIVIVSSKKSSLYDSVKRDRDALDKLMRESQNVDNQLQQMTDDELRKTANGSW